jgi:4-hydroxy-tetrahydrodipicolinate synthase
LQRPFLISAIGTPLDADDSLHVEGLHQHLDEQYAGQIDGILVAGTMGLMQLLADKTYYDLVAYSAERWRGKGELLVGVGDTSYARTAARIRTISDIRVDGVVALAPYFMSFSQPELVDYYSSLADLSRVPLFLYDLPQRTRTTLELDTVLALAEHPNISDIKCSGDIENTRLLIKSLEGSSFRVIVGQASLLDCLLREGIPEHLDGIYSIAPHWARKIAHAAVLGDWDAASRCMKVLTDFLSTVLQYGVFPAMTAILNARGTPGRFAPRPHRVLTEPIRRQLLDEPSVSRIFSDHVPRAHAVLDGFAD